MTAEVELWQVLLLLALYDIGKALGGALYEWVRR